MFKWNKIFLILFLFSSVYGADWESQQSGDWSRTSDNADSPWYDNGAQTALADIPDDGESFDINNGHTVVFDVDESGFVAGHTASSVSDGGILDVKDDAGDYYLSMGADLTLNGTLYAGTDADIPLTGTFTIDFNGASNSIVINDSTGVLNLYCNEPTLKYVSLTVDNADGTAIDPLDIDGDVSSDWSNGDTIAIVDLIVPGSSTRDNQEDTIAAMTSNTITLTGGLDSGIEVGSVIVLITRNIRLINSTDYCIKNGHNCEVYAEYYNNSTGVINGLDDSMIGGAVLVKDAVSAYTITSGFSNVYDIAIAQAGTGNSTGLNAIYNCSITSDSILAGLNLATSSAQSSSSSAYIAGCGTGYNNASSINILEDILGCQYGINNARSINIFGDIANVTTAINNSTDFTIANCEIGKSVDGKTSTKCFNDCQIGRLFNVKLSATTDFDGYDDEDYRLESQYVESFDHGQVENAYKAWCLGGVVTSQTASPPTGYTIWYELACEDTDQDYRCFRQYETVVLPGTAIEVEGKIRIADGEDLTDYEPRLQIIDKFADPLVDDTQEPLDEDLIPEPDGSETDWQDVSVIWANQGDSPRTVLVRMIVWNDGGVDDVDIDTVWSVASYQDQIATLYNVLMPLKTDVATADTTSSFTLTAGEATNDAYNNMSVMVQDADDDHWELRSISDWTSGRVITVDTAFSFTPAEDDLVYIMGTSYGAPTDNDAIADSVWDEAMSGHAGESTFGGELQTLDPNVILILADTSAYDTDAEHAEAIWGASVVSYNDEADFGGELGGLDPNLALVLADTSELQTDWTDGGRLDLLIDAIKKYTDLIVVKETSIASADSNSVFTITDGVTKNDYYNGMHIMVQDADDSSWLVKRIRDYTSAKLVTIDSALGFAPTKGDLAYIVGIVYSGDLDRFTQTTHIYDYTEGGGAGLTRYDIYGDDP